MSSGREARRDSKNDVNSAQAAQDHAAELPADVLSEIVAETAAQIAADEPKDPDLQAAMLMVAREHAGLPMTIDPVGTALLAAVLKQQFSFLANRPILLHRAAKTVAASLLGDLTARRRLEHLWAKLSEEVA